MIDVLLIIDNSCRELEGILLIQHFLSKLGLSSKICNPFNLIPAYNKYQPKAIVFPNAGHPIIETLSRSVYIFVLPSESGNGQKNQVLSTHRGTNSYHCYTECVDHFFSWGEQMKEWLIESGAYPRDHISATGHPATDHWLIPMKRVPNQIIGLTTTFRALNSSHGRKCNFIRFIYEIEKNGIPSYYEPPEHTESWFYWEASFIRVICNFITDVAIPNALRLQLRPHPLENIKPYLYLTKLSNGLVKAVKQGPISDWFQNIDLLLTFMSGSSIDAVVRGLPVVSLKNVLNQDALSRIPKGFIYDYDQYFWQLESFEQVKEYARDAFKGKLPVSPQREKLDDYIYRHFSYPRKKPAALLIAERIREILSNNKRRAFKRFSSSNPLKSSFQRVLHAWPDFYLVMTFLRTKLAELKGNTGFRAMYVTYQPWKRSEILKAKETAGRIIRAYK